MDNLLNVPNQAQPQIQPQALPNGNGNPVQGIALPAFNQLAGRTRITTRPAPMVKFDRPS